MRKCNVLKRIVCFMLIFAFVSMIVSKQEVYAANLENLISSVSNPSEKQLKITFWVPAKTTVNYTVYPNVKLNGGQYGQYVEKRTGSVTNTASYAKTMTKYVSVSNFGTYYVNASCYNGYTTDTDTVVSTLKSVKWSYRNYWSAEEVAEFYKGKRMEAIGNAVIDIMLSFSPAGYAYLILDTTVNYTSVVEVGPKTLHIWPIEGYSYQMSYVPTSKGIDIKLFSYDPDGKLIYSGVVARYYYSSGFTFRI